MQAVDRARHKSLPDANSTTYPFDRNTTDRPETDTVTGAALRRVLIRHTCQHGTLVYGTLRGDYAVAGALTKWPCNFSPAGNSLEDEPGSWDWYLASSRRKRADRWQIDTAKKRLVELGHTVEVDIDDTTPATDFVTYMARKVRARRAFGAEGPPGRRGNGCDRRRQPENR